VKGLELMARGRLEEVVVVQSEVRGEVSGVAADWNG
jgi:hypothetical protein